MIGLIYTFNECIPSFPTNDFNQEYHNLYYRMIKYIMCSSIITMVIASSLPGYCSITNGGFIGAFIGANYFNRRVLLAY